jgi:hypothetical protein
VITERGQTPFKTDVIVLDVFIRFEIFIFLIDTVISQMHEFVLLA